MNLDKQTSEAFRDDELWKKSDLWEAPLNEWEEDLWYEDEH